MKSFNYIITDELGLHARPAGILVKETGKFSSDVMLSCRGKSGNAKKLFGIMAMGIKNGDEVIVEVTGEDEDIAAVMLNEFFILNL